MSHCVICSAPVRNPTNKFALECGHVFHRMCVRKLIARTVVQQTQATCPICRDILTPSFAEKIQRQAKREIEDFKKEFNTAEDDDFIPFDEDEFTYAPTPPPRTPTPPLVIVISDDED
jgi:hypothetical protein